MTDHPDTPAPADQVRAGIVDRYSALARITLAGDTPVDCEPVSSQGGCFGAAAYEQIDRAAASEAALRSSLGCGNPVAVADLTSGDIVLDLGSGGGIDVLLSARRVAPGGIAYGVDASPDMLALARANIAEAGVTNVEFRHGHIEDLPLPDDHVNVVTSNCVINLSTDKPRVLTEAFRVLQPGGRFGVSDVVVADGFDAGARGAEGDCATGALSISEYRAGLVDVGFVDIKITLTHQVREGVHSAIVKAAKPCAPNGTTIRPMRADDADEVLAIYQAGIDTGHATFETTTPGWDDFDATRLARHRYVAADRDTGDVLGWTAVRAVSDRPVYAGVVEHAVYVHPGTLNHGIGTALLKALIGSTEAAGIWTLESGIFPENTASLALHHRAGFRTVGTRTRVGRHNGQWRDVILVEHRSQTIG